MAYNKTNWENLPSTSTPINATNLNKIENGISDCVSKSGDTLTGILTFNNTNNYEAIKKVRTVDGSNYTAVVGVGVAPSAKIELKDGSNTSLGSMEVRNNGIYNGNSGRKFVETEKLTWGKTMSFEMQPGQHALVMIDDSDCVMIWMTSGGMHFARILGNGVNVVLSGNVITITKKNNENLAGNAIIS